MDTEEPKITYGDINEYTKRRLAEGITDIDDWRPAGSSYIEDIVKVQYNTPIVPFGVRYWLKNGDSIIYVPNQSNVKKGK